jgi:hypothetical protein
MKYVKKDPAKICASSRGKTIGKGRMLFIIFGCKAPVGGPNKVYFEKKIIKYMGFGFVIGSFKRGK